jgi:hypothetical protein
MPVATMSGPDPNSYENFGAATALDGTTVVIGAPGNDTDGSGRGAVFVYRPGAFSAFRIDEMGDPYAPALGDADADGLPNLLEYALVLPATTPGIGPDVGVHSFPEGDRLRLLLARDPLRDDVTIEVQAAGDLAGPWTIIAATSRGAPFSGPGYLGGDSASPGLKTVEIRDVINLGNAARRFLRVKVSH